MRVLCTFLFCFLIFHKILVEDRNLFPLCKFLHTLLLIMNILILFLEEHFLKLQQYRTCFKHFPFHNIATLSGCEFLWKGYFQRILWKMKKSESSPSLPFLSLLFSSFPQVISHWKSFYSMLVHTNFS